MHKALPLDLGRAGIASVVADPEAPLVEFSLLSTAGGPTATWCFAPDECRELADALARPRRHEVQLVFRAATAAVYHAPKDWCSLTLLTVPGPTVQQQIMPSDCHPLAELLRWAADQVEGVTRG